MDYLKSVGDRIRTRRKELNITQDALAQMTGYTSRSSINKIEKGLVDIPQSKITEIADALLVTPAYLMGWEDDNSPAPDQLFGFTEQLTEDEKKWLDLYRNATEDVREKMVFIVESIAELQSNDQQSVTKKMRDSSRRK
jgi:transcriptional regulator with XRE-family HTH domain